MSLNAVLRRMERGDLTAHGFRSTFKDWAAESTTYPAELSEMALDHATRSVERMISAFIGPAFAEEDAKSLKAEWRRVADQLRPKVKKLADLLDETEDDVSA